MPIGHLGPIGDPLRNRGVPLLPFIYIGFVKKNDDAQKMGRLAVWIPEIGGQPNDESSWVIASYASPFFGASDISKVPNYFNDSQIAQQSYGLWMVPPDVNCEVAVFFANGDPARAFWFGCCVQQYMNHMVPGIAINTTTEPEPPTHVGPVIEYNKANVGDVEKPRRPPFHPLTNGLQVEGLKSDQERGVSSTSARRETPSQVFGLLSPRGNTIHIDDNHNGDAATGGSENEFIRLRTRSGTQVIIDETTGFVYINSKNGDAWLEVSDSGVDVYSANSVSIRAQGDFNVRADRNIMLDAGASICLNAPTINLNCKNMNLQTSENYMLSVLKDGSIHAGAGLKIKADKDLNIETGGDTTLKATGVQIRDGKAIYDNAGIAPSADTADATVPKAGKQLDTTQVKSTSGFNWTHGGGTINTICDRMPTHEPWNGHPRSNVPPPPLDDGPPSSGIQSAGDPNASVEDGCNFGAANTKPISSTTFNAISAAADKTGMPLATLLAFGDIESGFNPNAKNPKSSAGGLFQFINGTWDGMVRQYGNKYNVSGDQKYDANANAIMGAQFLKDNQTYLQNHGIANPTPGDLYAAHFMGPAGAVALKKAAQSDPNADAATLFPDQAAANSPIFKGKTVGQVYDNITNNANSKANAYANQQGLPPPCQRPGATPTNPSGTAGSKTNVGTIPAPTAGSAVAAAESNVGMNGAQAQDFMKKNGVDVSGNWCAAYTTASLRAAGIQGLTGSGANIASNYLTWGQPVDGAPQEGDVMVIGKGVSPGMLGSHVGLATGAPPQVINGVTYYQMIQGNYGGKVAYSLEPASSITVRRAST
jgi:Transglycosylase SLT domain